MKKDLCYIITVFDRSGSMSSIANDMIGGFNAFIKKQRDAKIGECKITFNQFDDIFEQIYKNVDVNDVKDLTSDTYQPRGCTALYDAVGKTVNSVGVDLNALPENERPEKVLVVVITDGLENASREFDAKKVREMVKHQTEVYNWEFVFLGANIDTWSTGESIGVAGCNTISYASTGVNSGTSTGMLWDTLGSKTVCYRACASSNASMAFTDEEREEQEKLIKTNKTTTITTTVS
jgi:hypothetical protein